MTPSSDETSFQGLFFRGRRALSARQNQNWLNDVLDTFQVFMSKFGRENYLFE